MFETYKDWYKSQRYDILLTIIPVLAGAILSFIWKTINLIIRKPDGTISCFINDILTNNDLQQAIFILITLFVLNRCRHSVYSCLTDKSAFIRYMRNICKFTEEGRRENMLVFYEVVTTTVRHFFAAWFVIWALWFTNYFGQYLFDNFQKSYAEMCLPKDKSNQKAAAIDKKSPTDSINCHTETYNYPLNSLQTDESLHNEKKEKVSHAFSTSLDFMSSAVLFFIYLLLNDVTVRRKERNIRGKSMLNGIIVMVIIALFFIVPSLYSLTLSGECYYIIQFWIALLLGFVSAITFTLLLGKLNSLYLQLPDILLYGLYIYAIAQTLMPLSLLCRFPQEMSIIKSENIGISQILYESFQTISLIGKMLLMLSILWITDKKRLVFYMIHRSLSLTSTPSALKTYNRYFPD